MKASEKFQKLTTLSISFWQIFGSFWQVLEFNENFRISDRVFDRVTSSSFPSKWSFFYLKPCNFIQIFEKLRLLKFKISYVIFKRLPSLVNQILQKFLCAKKYEQILPLLTGGFPRNLPMLKYLYIYILLILIIVNNKKCNEYF